jgi:methylmalonyl-CoA mutase N-terminal domain/subunit
MTAAVRLASLTAVDRLAGLRASRDGGAVVAALGRVRAAAASVENLMEPLLHAVRSEATVGEMCSALRDVWGEYREDAAV